MDVRDDFTIVYSGQYGAPVFALVLLLGLAPVQRLFPSKKRTVGAVYASAGLFGMVHWDWPNPIALFLLGLGLGWLAVRTARHPRPSPGPRTLQCGGDGDGLTQRMMIIQS